METVGFIGLGNMGSGMSRNIQKAGYPMVVYDVREEATKPLLERGARLAGSPAEAASLSDVTLVSLPGPKEVEDVAIGPQGILEGIVDGGIYVELSTSRPALIRRIEPMFRRKGAHVLDAPVAVIQGLNLGWGDMDSTVTFRLQEQRAGVEVRAPEVDPEQSARYITTHPDA